ncbi:MAG: MBL fold metallo-hydrolase [Pseudomonadota bacterium]
MKSDIRDLVGCLAGAVLIVGSFGSVAAENTQSGFAAVTYLGNVGVMVEQGETKILFDPLFRDDYGQYQLVPEAMRDQLLNGSAPFDAIDAIFISHAHGDHFNAVDVIQFHTAHPEALIVAPQQAIDTMLATGAVTDTLAARFISMDMDYGAEPVSLPFADLIVEAVRIPHAGGERRRPIQNFAYRVTLENTATVMHLGDADPEAEDFGAYGDHWDGRETDMAFPPYWFFLSESGQAAVSSTLNAAEHIGVHVPIFVPKVLRDTGATYFSVPGEVRGFETE